MLNERTKGKGVRVLLTEHHAMRRIGEWSYNSTHSSTSALDEGEWSASPAGSFTPRERTPSTHCIGGWVGPEVGLDEVYN